MRLFQSRRKKTARGDREEADNKMGNVASSCVDANGEAVKPGAVTPACAPTSYQSECEDSSKNNKLKSPWRRTWHGHHRRHKSSSDANPQSPKLRGTTWHGRRHHHRETSDNADPSAAATAATSEELPPVAPRHHHHFNPGKALNHFAHSIGQAFEALFHRDHKHSQHHQARTSAAAAPPLRVRGGVLLHGCATPAEHYERIRTAVAAVKELKGAEGLRAIGLEYRLVKCPEHQTPCHSVCGSIHSSSSSSRSCNDEDVEDGDTDEDEFVPGAAAFVALSEFGGGGGAGTRTSTSSAQEPQNSLSSLIQRIPSDLADSLRSNDGSIATPSHGDLRTIASLATLNDHGEALFGDNTTDQEGKDHATGDKGDNNIPKLFCNLCTRRLFHIESGVMVDEKNRAEFIADGEMYEAVSRLVQECAQDIMMQEGNLEWVTVEESSPSDDDSGKEPLRVLISSDHPLVSETDNGRPTVLICTGRGKVRAGIFSRKNLICTGLETATALPVVRDAVTRNLNIVIVDPNVHGDALGFVTFQKTMDFLEEHFGILDEETKESSSSSSPLSRDLSSREMFILSHSASGGHMARYFLDKCDCAFLRNIRAVAFTDSTHSIQWAKSADKKYLFDMLQSEQCVYFRCVQERGGLAGDGNKWYLHPAGEVVSTDSFWQHRFGTIRTMWAGTDEHSMTNWFAHTKIWDHFDYFLFGHKFRRPATMTLPQQLKK